MRNRLAGCVILVTAALSAQAPPHKPANAPAKQEVLSVQRLLSRQLKQEGDAALRRNQFDEAERKYLEAITPLRQDEFTPDFVAVFDALGELYARQNRKDDAIDATATALMSARYCGERTEACRSSIVPLMIRTSQMFLSAKEPDKAEEPARLVYDMARNNELPAEQRRIGYQIFLQYLEASAQPAQAAVLRDQVAELFAKPGARLAPLPPVFPAGEPQPKASLVTAEQRLGAVDYFFHTSADNFRYGRFARAEANLRSAIAIGGSGSGVNPRRMAEVYGSLSNLLWRLKRQDEAIDNTRKMVDFVTKETKPEASDIASAEYDLGMQLLNNRDRELANEQFDLAMKAAARCTERTHCDEIAANAQMMKGLILIGGGDFEQGEPLLKGLIEGRDGKLTDAQYNTLVKTYANTLRIYGRDDDARLIESKKR